MKHRARVETDNYLSLRSDNYLSLLILILLFAALGSYGQDSRFRPLNFSDSVYQFSGKKLVIPVVLMAYGFEQFAFEPLVDLNLRVNKEITSRVHSQFRIDDFTQYAPAVAIYGLNLVGIKGKHNFLDRSIILASSAAMVGISVTAIKRLTHIQRPDGTSFNAFPSGHTATAFASAEFLYQEYKDVSVWYGIAGYTVAAGTGFMRMYNNRHWLTDVVAGAGFGIISTKVAYWIFPKIKKRFFKNMEVRFSLLPSFDPRYGPAQ